ncbi:TBC1 domain family member 10 [Entomortierella parvispora]|uniref:TBC1 domain family member 10 n=1 Tax=Entomortierella parvispora TaxID=205924 RepID=A0A9P3H5X8_9FUNG|nr:TBC1 domain family member 10 [Entomortierella parvispora]
MTSTTVSVPAEAPPTQGLARGTALHNVSAENDQDLMFMAGEEVVLLERIGGGLCMGYCEGVVGRFQESAVDFTSSTTSTPSSSTDATIPSTSISEQEPPLLRPKNRSRASSATSIASENKNRATPDGSASLMPPKIIKISSTWDEEVSPALTVLSRHTLMSAMAMDSDASERAGPRKLMSEENLKVVSTVGGVTVGRRQVLSSPPAPQHSTAPVIPPRSSSRQSSTKGSQDTQPRLSTAGVSIGTKSSMSSITSFRDQNSGSLSIPTTNSLSHRSTDPTTQDRLDTAPRPQRSTPSSSNNSVSSRASSPVPFQQSHEGTGVIRNEATPSSRPVTPIPAKNQARYSRRQSLEDPGAQLQQEHEQDQRNHHEHDHYLHSVLEDIRSKTHHVLQKAGFTMAPNAGLYADHGSKEVDLTVVQMSPEVAQTPTTQAPVVQNSVTQTSVTKVPSRPRASSEAVMKNDIDNLSLARSSATGVSFALSTTESNTDKEKPKSKHGIFGRPRSRSVKENGPKIEVPLSMEQSRPISPGPTSSSPIMSRFDRLRPWVKSEQRQRSNSGPALHSDSNMRQKLNESLDKVPPRAAEPGERTVRPQRQRRTSEATAHTISSFITTKSWPGLPQGQQHYQSQQTMSSISQVMSTSSESSNPQKHRSKNWFGLPRRSSAHSVEDTRNPHILGHGIEGGIAPGRYFVPTLDENGEDGDDFDGAETDYHDDHDEDGGDEDDIGSNNGAGSRLFVNDYGFIYDLDDEMNQGQDLTGNGSSVGIDGLGSNVSTASDQDRKKVIRKQKLNRENELKWIHAATRLNADNVRRSTKYKKLIRRGVPTSVRGRVWLFLAKADFYRQPGLFEELQKREALPIHEVIERDIHRCYPDHVHFRDGMGGTGQQDLHAVLKAYAHYKPSVGYCQGMGRLVGMMLMQMPVEDAFWLLVATIEGYMQDYYTPTLRQLRIDAQVFERLLKDQDPVLADHLQKNDVIPLMYMTQWFMTLFTMSLPWASVLRVWDIFYFDGCKALFRVGLAILQLCRDHLLNKCPTSSELLAYILHIPLDILGPKPLLETALMIKLRRHSVQKLIAVTAESMDSKAAAQEKEKEKEKQERELKQQQQSLPPPPLSPLPQEIVSKEEHTNTSPSRPLSGSAAPLSSGSSPFSPLGVFKTRKRAGTVNK